MVEFIKRNLKLFKGNLKVFKLSLSFFFFAFYLSKNLQLDKSDMFVEPVSALGLKLYILVHFSCLNKKCR